MTDYTLEIQPAEYQIHVEAENREPIVVDYPSSVLNLTVDPHPFSLPISITRYVFMTPAMQWVVLHNKNTTFIQPVLFDLTGRKMIASVVANSESTLTVYFTCPQAGYVDVLFGAQTQTEVVYVTS